MCTILSCVVFVITVFPPPPIRPFNFGKLRWGRTTDCFLLFSIPPSPSPSLLCSGTRLMPGRLDHNAFLHESVPRRICITIFVPQSTTIHSCAGSAAAIIDSQGRDLACHKTSLMIAFYVMKNTLKSAWEAEFINWNNFSIIICHE